MKRLIHYGAVLLIIAGVAAGLLSTVNSITAPQIEKINKEIIKEARVEVLSEASSFDETNSTEVEEYIFIPGYNESGDLTGYVSTIRVNGYSGIITFVLGVDTNGTITGLKVTGQAETPGLGTNIEKSTWQALWTGRDKGYEFDKTVDAFAGATVSPNAVYTGTIKALEAFEEVKK